MKERGNSRCRDMDWKASGGWGGGKEVFAWKTERVVELLAQEQIRLSLALRLSNLFRISQPRPQVLPCCHEVGSEVTRKELDFCPALGKSLTSLASTSPFENL